MFFTLGLVPQQVRMIDAVLFDLGDTIIDFGVGRREVEVLFRQGARLSYEHLREIAAPGLPAFERYFAVHSRIMRRAYIWSKLSRRDFSYQLVLARAAAKLGMTLPSAELDRLAAIWYRPVHLLATTDPGIPTMLRELKTAGTKMAIVSNTLVPAHCLDRHLEQEGLLEFFPVRIYSSHVRYRKPHPRIFQMALDLVGVPASRALFIGDLLKTDIAGAKNAGMRTIWKPAGAALRKTPRPAAPRRLTPDLIIHKITHLPEALGKLGWRPGVPQATA